MATPFTKQSVTKIGDEMFQVLQDYAKAHGLHIQRGRGKYSATNFSMAFEVSQVSTDGTVQTKEHESFLRNAESYGLKAADLGRVFVYNRTPFKVIGLCPKRVKYPILVENLSTKKQVLMNEVTVKAMLNMATKEAA